MTAQKLLAEKDARIKELETECERERMRLAGCGVAALGYFEGCHEDYTSASLQDVLKLRKHFSETQAALDVARKGLNHRRSHYHDNEWRDVDDCPACVALAPPATASRMKELQAMERVVEAAKEHMKSYPGDGPGHDTELFDALSELDAARSDR